MSSKIWIYDVEVRAETRLFDVKVDPDKGTVIAAIEDEPDDDATDWSDPRHHGNEIGLLTVSSFVRANDAYFNC